MHHYSYLIVIGCPEATLVLDILHVASSQWSVVPTASLQTRCSVSVQCITNHALDADHCKMHKRSGRSKTNSRMQLGIMLITCECILLADNRRQKPWQLLQAGHWHKLSHAQAGHLHQKFGKWASAPQACFIACICVGQASIVTPLQVSL